MTVVIASTEKENILAQQTNAHTIAGFDEVGRGAVSGPFVVGCVVRHATDEFIGMRDSKKLSERQRHALLPHILSTCASWSIGLVSAEEINTHGMRWAIDMGFARALRALLISPDLVLYDGRPMRFNHKNAKAIVHGDATHATISAASILAKTIRDVLMQEYDADFPQFGFSSHKGYGTRMHMRALARYGVLPKIHRTTFVESLLSRLPD